MRRARGRFILRFYSPAASSSAPSSQATALHSSSPVERRLCIVSMADESERKHSTRVVDATVATVPELGGTAGREERKRAARRSGQQQVAAGDGACETDSDSKRPSFEGFCARDYLDQYWPPQEPMDDEGKPL